MAQTNKSDPTIVQKLREKVEKEKKGNNATSKSANKSDPTIVQKLREKVMKDNPEYRNKVPLSQGGTDLRNPLGASSISWYDVDKTQQYLSNRVGLDTLSVDFTNTNNALNNVLNGWQSPETMKSTKADVEKMYKKLGIISENQAAFRNWGLINPEFPVTDVYNEYGKILEEWDSRADFYGMYQNGEAYTKDQSEVNKLYSLTSKDIKNHPNYKADTVAYTTALGEKIYWDDLYNDAYLKEYEQGITSQYDIDKYGAYVEQDKEGVYHENPWWMQFLLGLAQQDPSTSYMAENPDKKTIRNLNVHTYNFINGENEALKYESDKNAELFGYNDAYRYEYFTDEEKKIFNTIWSQLGEEKAMEYVKMHDDVLRARRVAAERKAYAETAQTAPVISSLVTVPAKAVTSVPEALFVGIDYAIDRKIDPNSIFYQGTRYTDETRNTVGNMIDNDFGEFFYQTGMGLADNVAAMAASGFGAFGSMSKAAQTSIMSSGSFTSTVLDAKQRGVSDEGALGLGAIAGAVEAFTESKGFDALFDKALKSKSVKGYLLKNFLTEEFGEYGTQVTNDVADFLIAQDKSQWVNSIDMYKKQGFTDEEAFQKTLNNKIWEYVELGGSTLLTTGALTAGSIATDKVFQDKNQAPNHDYTTDFTSDSVVINQEPDTLEKAARDAVANKVDPEEWANRPLEEWELLEGEEVGQTVDNNKPTSRRLESWELLDGEEEGKVIYIDTTEEAPSSSSSQIDELLAEYDRGKALSEQTSQSDTTVRSHTPSPVTFSSEIDTTPTPDAKTAKTASKTATETPILERLEELSRRNEPITVEEAKQASGYGDYGAKVLAETVNNSKDRTFSEVKGDMHLAYESGLVNKTIELDTDVKREAYFAGKQDREIGKIKATEGIFENKVFGYQESGLITPESTNKGSLKPVAVPESVTPEMANALDVVGKALGRKVMFVDDITAENGISKASASVSDDGVFRISANTKKPLYELIVHEPLHIMRQENTAEYHAFVDFAVQNSELLGLRIDTNTSVGTVYERLHNTYESKGLDLEANGILDEIAARFAEKLVSNDQEAIDLINKMNQNEDTRTALQKFIKVFKDVINKLKELWKRLRNHGEYSAAREVNENISELEKGLELYEKAYRATQKAVEKRVAEQGAEQTAQKNTGTEGGAKKSDYSIREEFYSEFDEWVADGKDDPNRRFVVGNTSEALKSIGIKNQEIVLRSGTIIQKLNKHKEMTTDIFKKIPELLEHPIIVQFSDAIDENTQKPKYESRITVLGELYAEVYEDGKKVQKPVLVSLELLPTNRKKTAILDFSIIKSAYAKDALQTYLNENSILYIEPNKKRTNTWLSLNRLQLPLGETKYGSIRSITYIGKKVKIQNSINKTPMQKALEKVGVLDEYGNTNYSLEDTEGNTLTEEQQNYFADSKVRDENGNLKVMYRGDANEFTVFDRKKSRASNLYGRGFYFTDSKSHAEQYGKATEYYLDIKNPLSPNQHSITKAQMLKFLEAIENDGEDYDLYNYGEGATAETVLDAVWGKGDFEMLQDVNAGAIGDLVAAVELFNEVNGTNYDGLILPTETVTFVSEQAKLTSNKKPTNNPDTRFSLEEPIEETKDLIAVHNVRENKLREALELGGLPSPSIAVTKKDFSHDNFGDISLIFHKETINPADRRNKVYGGDAYTPTRQEIDYKISDKVLDKIAKRIENLVDSDIRRAFRLSLDDSNVTDDIRRANGNFVEAYKGNEALKIAFLKDKGVPFKSVMKVKQFSDLADNIVLRRVSRAIGEDNIKKAMRDSEFASAQEPMIRKLLNDRMEEQGAPRIYDKHLSARQVSDIIFATDDYIRLGETKSVDYYATRDKLKNKFTKKLSADYEAWLAELGEGIVEKKGIRNDKDMFTSSGNRRSFEALHWEYNLENIVRAMNSEQSKGAAALGGSVFGASTKEYASIADIKADSSRLREMTYEEYEALKSEYKERLDDIAQAYSNGKSFFDAEDTLIEAIATKKTKQGVRSFLAQFDYVYKVTDDIVNDLWELRNEIAEMPVSYFEAKPQRAVGFEEVAAAIIPKSKDKSLKAELEARGVNVLEYDKNKEGDRLKKINRVSSVAFSLEDDIKISTKDTKELLDVIEHLQNEFKRTEFAKADPKKLADMTKKLLREYSSKANYETVLENIDDLYTYIANGEDGHPAVWEDVYNGAMSIANDIVKAAVAVDDSAYREYEALRKYLRTVPIKFNSAYDSVPSSYENFRDFRRKNYGRLNFTKDGMSIDSMYQELSDMYPEFFNSEEETNSTDMLERIVDVLDEIQPTTINPFSHEMSEVSTYLANDIISRFFEIPQAKPTFADKAERRVIKAEIAGAKKVERVRQQRDEKIQKLLADHRAKTKQLVENAKKAKLEAVSKEKAKREKAVSKMKESQKAKVLRARIMRHASELSKKLLHPSDNQHIPQNLQGAVAALLEHINLESNYTYDATSDSYKKNDEGLPTSRSAAFEVLRKVYSQIAESAVIDPDLMGDDGLLSDVIALGDKRIADMTSAELDTVWQTMRAIEATISTANKLFSASKFEAISEITNALRVDNDGKKVRKELRIGNKVQTLAQLNMLTPETYFHYLGDAGDAIFRMMRDAQDKHISIMKEVTDFTHKVLKDVNINKLEKTLHTVTLGGEKVTLTTAQLMELYVLMKRKQAVEHILLGGILPDNIDKGVWKKNKVEPTRNIKQEEIGKALSELTDEEKAIADKLQNFVSTVLSRHGNEASMQVYNYEKFLEENYWTIRTNKQEVASDVGKDTAVITVANKGMAKGTIPHANTSVRIGSIFDTFSAHSSDMATYAAWLGTTEDINRIRNFVFWEDGARTGTVKGIIDTVHGTHGTEYLHKLLTDVSIGVRGTDNMNPFDKLTGNYKAASVGANIRVIIQQPTAILRALDMIAPQYIGLSGVKPLAGWSKAKKYAPIAQWKDWGHFDINTGRQMKDVLFDNASVLEKVKQAGMWGASMADSISWGVLWNAVEAETKAKHKDLKVGSKEYYNTVSKRFTEIVDHTQVVDGILQRSGLMRSPDSLTKMATSFMGEPTKQYNMAASAIYDVVTKKGEDKRKAAGRLGRTAISLAVAGIVNACVQSIIDALRDDDKEKEYWEKWLASFGENAIDTVNPLNYVPFAKDVVSIFQGYDVKRMDTETITKTYSAVENMYKAVTGTGKYTIANASANLFAEVARLFGVPVANVKRDVLSVITTIAIQTDNYLMQYRIEKAMLDINYAYNRKNFMDILFNAYNNDREAYELIYNDLLKSGYDVETIQDNMETRMKKAEGVKEASELSKRYMTPEDEKKYDNSLAKIQSSGVWKSANEEQRKDAEADLFEFLTSTAKDVEKSRAEARAFGVDETEYTLWQLAMEMSDDGNNSYDAKEKAKAVEMLNLGDAEITYFYNTKQADEAYAHGLDMMNYALFKAAVSGLKGDDKEQKVKAYAKQYADTEKERLFFMGTVYDSWKKRNDYIKYFGK